LTLHPRVVADLIDKEVTVARDRLGSRVLDIEATPPLVLCRFEVDDAVHRLCLDCRHYDAEPPRLSAVTRMVIRFPVRRGPPACSTPQPPCTRSSGFRGRVPGGLSSTTRTRAIPVGTTPGSSTGVTFGYLTS
jgi:hypothetical protein